MSTIIPPGSIIKIRLDFRFRKIDSKSNPRTKSSPNADIQYALVSKTEEKALIISEADSNNGIACIIPHDNSARTGKYTYVYHNKQHLEVKYEITSLSLLLLNNKTTEIYKNEFLTC